MNGPLKNKKSRQILPKSRNLHNLVVDLGVSDFVSVGRSHICFSIKSLNFSVSGSDFKMPVYASRRVSDLPFATLSVIAICNDACNVAEVGSISTFGTLQKKLHAAPAMPVTRSNSVVACNVACSFSSCDSAFTRSCF